MSKHGGCYVCGSRTQEILTSRMVAGIQDLSNVALCDDCLKLDARELRIRVRQIEEARIEMLRKIREGQANA